MKCRTPAVHCRCAPEVQFDIASCPLPTLKVLNNTFPNSCCSLSRFLNLNSLRVWTFCLAQHPRPSILFSPLSFSPRGPGSFPTWSPNEPKSVVFVITSCYHERWPTASYSGVFASKLNSRTFCSWHMTLVCRIGTLLRSFWFYLAATFLLLSTSYRFFSSFFFLTVTLFSF